MTAREEVNLAESAYRTLLRLPLGCNTRARLQRALANLRDEIAYQNNRTAEDVQNEFEAEAALISGESTK